MAFWDSPKWPLKRGVLTSARGGLLGFSKVAFIEGCPHVRGGLYRGVSSRQLGVAFWDSPKWPLQRGVLTSGVAFIEGCPHVS